LQVLLINGPLLVHFFSIDLNISPWRRKPMMTTATHNKHYTETHATEPVLFLAFELCVYGRVRIDACLCSWGYGHKSINHGRGEFTRDDDGDGFCEVHVNTMEGFWSLLQSWLRPPQGEQKITAPGERLKLHGHSAEMRHQDTFAEVSVWLVDAKPPSQCSSRLLNVRRSWRGSMRPVYLLGWLGVPELSYSWLTE
jgi:hypothetical protein